jgi:uncharacterized protein (TIGR02646 family)
MMKLQRPAPPEILAQNWEAWGIEYEQKRRQNPKYEFKWRKKVYLLLIDLLLRMTKDHCSFCDSSPMRSQIRETIEHFHPKKDRPRLVYQWENLFACCDRCQNAKQDRFEEALLKPDEIEYEFKRYFFFEEVTGKLIPNSDASSEDQNRAATTIRLYKLNEFGRPEARLWVLELARLCPTLPIDKHPYRFMFL